MYFQNEVDNVMDSKKHLFENVKKSLAKKHDEKDLSKILYDLNHIKKGLLKNKRSYEISLIKLKESKFNMLKNIRKKAELMISDYERNLTSSDLIASDRISQIEHEEYIIELALNKKYKLNHEELLKIKTQAEFFQNFKMDTPDTIEDFDIK